MYHYSDVKKIYHTKAIIPNPDIILDDSKSNPITITNHTINPNKDKYLCSSFIILLFLSIFYLNVRIKNLIRRIFAFCVGV